MPPLLYLNAAARQNSMKWVEQIEMLLIDMLAMQWGMMFELPYALIYA